MAATRSNEVGGTDYITGALKPDVLNPIHLNSAHKTPFSNVCGMTKATNTRHETLNFELEAISLDIQSPSYQFNTDDNVSLTVNRPSNYVGTWATSIHLDGNTMKSMTYGQMKDWFKQTADHREKELRLNAEATYVRKYLTDASNEAYDSGNIPQPASLSAYAGIVNRLPAIGIEYDDDTAITSTAGEAVWIGSATQAAKGSNGVQFTGAVAESDLVSITTAHINDTLKVISDQGGDVNTMMVSTGLKSAVSEALIAGNGGAAQRRAGELASRVVLYVDTIMAEYGYTLDVIHNHVMSKNTLGGENSTAYIFNRNSVKRAVMERYQLVPDGTARRGKGASAFFAETLEAFAANEVAMIMGATS